MSYKQIFDVRGMSARGDGVTDDTAAIENALQLIGNGNTLSFPPGNYFVRNGITLVDRRNMHFEPGTTVTAATGSALKMSVPGSVVVTGAGTFVGAGGSAGVTITSTATSGSLTMQYLSSTILNQGGVTVTAQAGPTGANVESTLYLVVDGDSNTANNGPIVGVNNWFNQLCRFAENVRVIGKNFAFNGKTMAQVLSSYSTSGTTPSNTVAGGHRWSPSVTGGRGIYILPIGVNDAGADTPAATMLQNLNALCDLAHADGYQQVVGFTIHPNGWGDDRETQRLAYNSALVQGATATATIGGGAVTSVAVNTGGTLYQAAPTVTFTGGAGTGATATATLTAGVVTAITVTNGGSGYSSAPAVIISGASRADVIFDVTTLISQPDGPFFAIGHWTALAHVLVAQELWARLNGAPGAYYPSTKCAYVSGSSYSGATAYPQQLQGWLASYDDAALWRIQTNQAAMPMFGTIASFGTTTITMNNSFSPGQLVRFSSTGTLPTGLAVSTDYWVTAANGTTFSVASAPGGSAISLAGGSGTHSVLACWVWQAPRAGVVRVVCRMVHTVNNSSDVWRLWIYKNGAAAEMLDYAQGILQIGGDCRTVVSPGDLLDMRLEPVTSSGSQVILANAGFSELSIGYDYLLS